MTGFLLNIGHDIAGILIEMITYVNKWRAKGFLFKVLLWPVSYALTFAKVMTLYLANGCHRFYNHSFPEGVVSTRNHLYSATPASIYCFNKRGILLFLLEIYSFCFFCVWILERPFRIYPYLVAKVVITLIPFVALTPTQRLPFWILAIVLNFFEIWMGLWFIISMGYGINFAQDNFYNHWAKHYRYKAPTSNRQIFIELSTYVFTVVKLLVLNDYFCYDATLRAARLAAPHTPTKGCLAQDALTLFTGACDWSSFAVVLFLASGYFLLFSTHFKASELHMSESNLTYNALSTEKNYSLTQFLRFLHEYLLANVTPYPFLVFVVSTALLMLFTAHLSATLHPSTVRPVSGRTLCCFALVETPSSLPGVSEETAARAAATWSSTTNRLSPDYDYLNALVEQDSVASLRYGVLFLLALSSLGVYSIILAGWSSNSKYAFIGALRSAAQMISYEVAISLIILPVVLFSGSLDLSMITYVQSITDWLLFPLLPIALLFLIAMLAETNRTPFDLPEAEAELVAGYNVDYSSLPFAMFFLGEYCNMILISTMYCLLFLSGGLNSLGLASAFVLSAKAAVTWIFFVLVRATLPRYRYDQLMDIGWKVFLPVSGSFLLFVFGILVFFAALPVTNELPLSFRVEAPATPTTVGTECVPCNTESAKQSTECVACNLGPVDQDDECIDCDVDPEDRDESKSLLSAEERAWVERETMRFINDTYRENMTPEEINEWSLHVLNVNRTMVAYVLSRHEAAVA
jgi:formate hydrogenlyase subunit 4